MRDPGTNPPPKTRSSSDKPVTIRRVSSNATFVNAVGWGTLWDNCACGTFALGRSNSSTN